MSASDLDAPFRFFELRVTEPRQLQPALVQLGRAQPLHHRGGRVAAGRQPGPAGVPVADVGAGEDGAPAGGQGGVDVVAALDAQPLPDRGGGQVLQPEGLDPVAAVAGEAAPDRPLELAAARPGAEDLGQVGRQGLAPVTEKTVTAPAERVWAALTEPELVREWFGWDYPGLDDAVLVADLIAGRTPEALRILADEHAARRVHPH